MTSNRLCSGGIQRFISPPDAHFHLFNLISSNIKSQKTTFIQKGKAPEDVGYQKNIFKHVQALNYILQ